MKPCNRCSFLSVQPRWWCSLSFLSPDRLCTLNTPPKDSVVAQNAKEKAEKEKAGKEKG